MALSHYFYEPHVGSRVMYKYFISAIIISLYMSGPTAAQFIARQHTVKDLSSGTTWLRCSVGQAWDPAFDTCTGEIVKLDQTQISFAIKEAKRQLGGNWRLPTRDELEASYATPALHQKLTLNTFQAFLLRRIGPAIRTY